MAILSDFDILRAIKVGQIVVDPFDRKNVGTNSIDVHLGKYLVYPTDRVLSMKQHTLTYEDEIHDEGFVLEPGKLYLGATEEYTETHGFVPYLDGRSSVGRLGLFIHVTAGRGDAGFCGHWTMELVAVQPLRIYAGVRIGQLTYHTLTSPPEVPYDQKKTASYCNRDPKPQASRLWKNF